MDLRDIQLISHESPAVAEQAFNRVSPRARRFLGSLLRQMNAGEDNEDIVNETLLRLWENRRKVHFESIAKFLAYLKKVARSILLKIEHDGQLGETDLPSEYDGIFELVSKLDRERLYQLADELWLKTPADERRSDRNLRILAVRLMLIDGLAWEEVCEMLSQAAYVSREQLDAWSEDVATLLNICYAEVYLSNDALAAHLLDSENPPAPADLDRLASSLKSKEEPAGEPPAGWTWDEIRVLLMRFRYGFTHEHIEQRFPHLKAEPTIEACLARLPFKDKALSLRDALLSAACRQTPLKEQGLYRRLAFQYYAFDELPQRQIFERSGPVSEVGGYHFTEGMLNMWLSGDRMLNELIKYVGGRRGRA